MTHILNETFDAVYVLNLDRRADRWEECKEIAHSCGLTLDRLSGIDGAKLKEWEGIFPKGISEEHKAAL